MVRDDLTNEQYHKGEGLSKSDLDALHKSPAHYMAKANLTTDTDSRALFIGTAVHMAVLEPELFAKTYAALPEDFNGRTKEGKALSAQFEAEGKMPLKADEFAMMAAIRDSVHASPIAAALLKGARCEMSGFAEINGVLCKCRPDIWAPDRHIIADLKTTQDASEKAFQKSIANYRYYVQAAFYIDVWSKAADTEVNGFVFIAVEKTPPYAVALYTISPDFLEIGRREYTEDLEVYKKCLESGKWQGYCNKISEIMPPAWL